MAAFHDVQFPPRISYGATGGPAYRTTVVQASAGHEQRMAEWDDALLKWTVTQQVENETRLSDLVAFFHARQGRAYGFRFKDWSDYSVGKIWADSVLIHNVATAQQFGIGNGSAVAFQLTKTYSSGGVVRTRRITRPVAGSVKIYFGTTEQTTGWTLNAATGLVTFAVAPPNATVIKWSGEFDVPARFESDEMALNIEAIRIGAWSGIGIVGLKE